MVNRIRVRISAREYEILKQICEGLKTESRNDNSVGILLDSKNELEVIIENISSSFLRKGLQKDFEPNSIGYELEDLNDKFIQKLQELND